VKVDPSISNVAVNSSSHSAHVSSPVLSRYQSYRVNKQVLRCYGASPVVRLHHLTPSGEGRATHDNTKPGAMLGLMLFSEVVLQKVN